MRRFATLISVIAVVVASAAVAAPAASAAILDVTLAGGGTGSVTSSITGINCSNVPGSEQTSCSHDYGFNFSTNFLTATPAEGSAFLSWSGGGGTCSGTTNPCETASLLLAQSITATFEPAPDPPVPSTGAASDIEFPRARVVGLVNPDNDDFPVTDCYFEYGLTTDYGERASCSPGSIGTGTSAVAVSASIGVLEPNRVYHYRLVARNGGGAGYGEDQTFTSGAGPDDACSNSAIRAEQGAFAQRLPNCGAYELVSPPFTAGQSVSVSVGTAEGNRAMIQSVGGFAGADYLPLLGMSYAAERTDSGWKTTALAPPGWDFPYVHGSATIDYTRDGSRSLWMANLKADEGTSRFTPIVRDPDGSFHIAGPTQDNSALPVGTSEDLLMVVQQTTTHLPTTDGTANDRLAQYASLYRSTRGPDGELSVAQVAYRDGATMFPSCSVNVGGTTPAGGTFTARNAISADGEKIFFTAARDGAGGGCDAAASRRVWAKIGDADPVDLSAPRCPPDTCGAQRPASFRGAARDGSRVYFTTEQQLLPTDQDSSAQNDLYEYDFGAPEGEELRLVTGSEDAAGAGVNALGLLRVSPDGAYVYFVATGRALAGENARGDSPVPGGNNLYVYHRPAGEPAGTIAFVADLGAGLGGSTVLADHPQMSSTGRFLLVETNANLTGERLAGDEHTDVYRYDAQEDELSRVWTDDPAHNGAARVDGITARVSQGSPGSVPSGASQSGFGWSRNLQISDDGSLVGFTTAEPLSPDDRNDRTDGYLWQAGTGDITLLTDGSSRPSKRRNGAAFGGMTPSGDSLFVLSSFPLVKAHSSGQVAAYVIRAGGGFPAETPAPELCVGDSCQPASGPLPATPPTRSDGSTGRGNAPSASMSVRKARPGAVRGRAVRLRVRVSTAGRLRVAGRTVRNAARSVGKARTVPIRVALNRKGLRRLDKRGRLRVKMRVVFRAEAGGSIARTVGVTFKKRQANTKGGR